MAEHETNWNHSDAVDEQVEALLRQMSLEEKIDLVSGKNDVAGKPDLAKNWQAPYPALALADGPAGVRMVKEGKATALPAPIALAATWNPDLARHYGDVLGAEMAATGHNILLGPAVDIARTPVGGRTFESFGEDPLLQARLVVPEIQAIQAHPVQVCLKHYLVNNQEYQRTTIDVRVNERTLQEIYLPPFAAAVRQGHVAAVMGSYNKINGMYACENRHLLTTILREQLGFRGWVMSDYMANHSTAESANAGLEWELSDQKLWGANLQDAVQSGQVGVETVDQMVRRILRPTVGLGLLDHPIAVSPLPVQQHSEMARRIAEQGIVLLKNVGDMLPLNANTLHTIAVIGPDADNVSAAGGGSAHVNPIDAVSVLEGIRQRVGTGVRVEYAPGTDPLGPAALLPGPPAVPSSVLPPPDAIPGEQGLRVEYWANPHFAGQPSLRRIEPTAELHRGFFDFIPELSAASPKLPGPLANLGCKISVRWTGSLIAPVTGDYLLSLTSLDTARLYLDGQLLMDVVPASRTKCLYTPDDYDSIYKLCLNQVKASRLRLE